MVCPLFSDLHSPYNGIALPKCKCSQKNRGKNNNAAIHNGSHANYSTQVQSELEAIYAYMDAPTLPSIQFIDEIQSRLQPYIRTLTKHCLCP
ncbi:AHH domain-containing protein [Chitinibacter sp. GC72]|uniref:AHH domain-containing protein n=1 Tax=Chitinibacter sp. GC72 TaxID=1526917 RepID=UPI0012FC3A2C